MKIKFNLKTAFGRNFAKDQATNPLPPSRENKKMNMKPFCTAKVYSLYSAFEKYADRIAWVT